jgi:hypothetical protein
VVGIFPDDAAVTRLATAVLIEAHDEWQIADRRYLSEGSMALLAPISDDGSQSKEVRRATAELVAPQRPAPASSLRFTTTPSFPPLTGTRPRDVIEELVSRSGWPRWSRSRRPPPRSRWCSSKRWSARGCWS